MCVNESANAAPDLAADVSRTMERAIADGTVRAASIGFYDDGATRVVGFGRLGRDDPRTPDGGTAFEIGSISKVFTALLAQTQVDAGRLSWSDTIAERLNARPFASGRVAAIELRELATHASGLPTLPANFAPTDFEDPYAGYDRERLIGFLTGFDPPGLDKEYAYSNLGMGLLGEIAADAAGAPYAEAMAREVLGPLALRDTSVAATPELAERLAQGYSAGIDMPNWGGFDALAGAGALVSTVDDMLGFIAANLEPDALADALGAIAVPRGAGVTGYGWHLQSFGDGDTVLWHNGSTGGYASFLAIRPQARTGIVVLTASTDAGLVTDLGFTAIVGAPESPAGISDLSPYPGTYRLDDDFLLTVYRDDDELFAQATGQAAFRLRAVDAHRFAYVPADIEIEFAKLDDGAAQALTLTQAGTVTPAARIDDTDLDPIREIIRLDAANLADYVGEYTLAPGVVITVDAAGEQLYAQLTHQARFPVFAYADARFVYRVVDARLEFERDASGAVVAVILHQHGKQRAPRRQVGEQPD